MAKILHQKINIFLVHGTFAKNAGWTRADSILTNLLKEKFKNCNVEKFTWSGHNSLKDRVHATDELVKKINTQRQATNYIIAHSHGGNIAVNSLREANVNISGIFCLNTPFLYVSDRDIGDAFIYSLVGIKLILIVIGIIINTWYIWLLCLFGFLLAFDIVFRLESIAENSGSKYKNQINPKRHKVCPIICITVNDDEAFGILQLLENVANLPALILGSWMSRGLIIIAMILSLFFLNPVEAQLEKYFSNFEDFHQIWKNIFTSLVISQFTYPILLFIFYIFSYLLRGISQGVYTPTLAHLSIRTLVSIIPIGCYNPIELLEICASKNRNKKNAYSMKHGHLYSDISTIHTIIRYVESIENDRKYDKK